MTIRPILLMVGALLYIGAFPSASAQAVYKCWSRGSVTYSHIPCSKRIVNTDEAPVPAKPNREEVDLRRLEHNQVVARALRPRAGESAEQFETRRRRAGMLPQDRAECERLDVRMPVEEASTKNPDKEAVFKADAVLVESKKRFSELRC